MSHRILLVDDEAMLRNLMASVLESAGYSVVAKENAEEVLAMLESGEFPFDLVASDVQLENMDGIELAPGCGRSVRGGVSRSRRISQADKKST